MKESPRVRAFTDTLAPHAEHGTKTREGALLQLQNRTDLVVRPLKWKQMLKKKRFDGTVYANASAEEFARITKSHFDELRQYGIDAPASFVVAHQSVNKKKREKEVFAVVDNVRRSEHVDVRAVGEAFADSRGKLLRYLSDKFETNTSFLSDLVKDYNYIFGKRGSDTEDQLYLIDVDPYMNHGPRVLRLILRDMKSHLVAEREHFKNTRYDSLLIQCDELASRVEAAVNEQEELES